MKQQLRANTNNMYFYNMNSLDISICYNIYLSVTDNHKEHMNKVFVSW
jgi:hypothetical protein